MSSIPEVSQRVQSTIGGVTYKGTYWVDDEKHLVNVATEFGSKRSTPALKRHHAVDARNKANESAALGLFRSMVYEHRQANNIP
jgi:hypothetical protein